MRDRPLQDRRARVTSLPRTDTHTSGLDYFRATYWKPESLTAGWPLRRQHQPNRGRVRTGTARTQYLSHTNSNGISSLGTMLFLTNFRFFLFSCFFQKIRNIRKINVCRLSPHVLKTTCTRLSVNIYKKKISGEAMLTKGFSGHLRSRYLGVSVDSGLLAGPATFF